VQDYNEAHRAELYSDKKSRETPVCVMGFEFTPWRVDSTLRAPKGQGMKWQPVLDRLARFPWASRYLRFLPPQVNKDALLADRDVLSPEQCEKIGIAFAQTENFFCKAKAETADNSK
jgi:phage host-nuclease inhibitor protein Gam